VTCRFHKRLLQALALIVIAAGFAKPCCKADRATSADFTQLAHDVDGQVAVDANECRIGRGRKVAKRAIGFDPGNLALCRVNRPDIALEPHLEALLDDVRREETAADDGDGFRPQKTMKAAHPP